MAKRNERDLRLRHQLAQEAARWLAQNHSRDFLQAKQRAAHSLGVSSQRLWPGNEEVELALREYQQLFMADSHHHDLQHLRQTAIHAMRMLNRFRPRLVGAVLVGTAQRHQPVNLHVFADTPEEVGVLLMDRQVPYEEGERTLRESSGGQACYPMFRFLAGETTVELTVFPPRRLGHAPLSPIDGRPMHRADLNEVEALLA